MGVSIIFSWNLAHQPTMTSAHEYLENLVEQWQKLYECLGVSVEDLE